MSPLSRIWKKEKKSQEIERRGREKREERREKREERREKSGTTVLQKRKEERRRKRENRKNQNQKNLCVLNCVTVQLRLGFDQTPTHREEEEIQSGQREARRSFSPLIGKKVWLLERGLVQRVILKETQFSFFVFVFWLQNYKNLLWLL